MARALIFSGGGDYDDPWHSYAETSELLAETLRALEFEVEVTDDVDTALSALDDEPDLFALNAGAGPDPHPRDGELADAALVHVGRGAGLLVLHLSIGLFPAFARWEETVGGRWVWGVSHHPPRGLLHVEVTREADASDGAGDFDIVDEGYAGIRLGAGSSVLAAHTLAGERHPLIWSRRAGSGRVVVDLLGHDGASFESAEHRGILGRAVRWAAYSPAGGSNSAAASST